MKKILTALSALAILAGCAEKPAAVTDVQTLKSPSGNMEMTFHLTAEGTPQTPSTTVTSRSSSLQTSVLSSVVSSRPSSWSSIRTAQSQRKTVSLATLSTTVSRWKV